MSDFDIIKSTDIGVANPTGRMIDGKKECLLNANLIKPIILYSPSTLGNSIKYNGKNLISHINASLSTNSNPKVWYESDSTRNPFGSSPINSIYYGNGKYVAVGIDGKMAYSTDGITWTAVADSTFGSSYIESICYGNRKFVAGGYKGKMAYSTDGVTWTAVANSIFNYDDIYSTCYGNGKFVAGGRGGKMAYSTDGITWTKVDNSTFGSSYIESICYGNGKFVAGGYDGKMAYCQVGIPE